MAKCESPIEQKLYNAMLEQGLLPIRQYWIGKYRVDFAFIEERLVVEADGKKFHRNKRKDAFRETYIKRRGWRVLRFSGSQIFRSSRGCVTEIKRKLR